MATGSHGLRCGTTTVRGEGRGLGNDARQHVRVTPERLGGSVSVRVRALLPVRLPPPFDLLFRALSVLRPQWAAMSPSVRLSFLGGGVRRRARVDGLPFTRVLRRLGVVIEFDKEGHGVFVAVLLPAGGGGGGNEWSSVVPRAGWVEVRRAPRSRSAIEWQSARSPIRGALLNCRKRRIGCLSEQHKTRARKAMHYIAPTSTGNDRCVRHTDATVPSGDVLDTGGKTGGGRGRVGARCV